MRLVIALLLLLVAAACALGLLATLEPMDGDRQLLWRVVYGSGLVACLAGAAWAVVGGRARA